MKIMYNRVVWVLVMTVSAVLVAVSTLAGSPKVESSRPTTITSSEMAVEISLRYLGLPSGAATAAHVSTMDSVLFDKTPFLGDSLTGHRVYSVQFPPEILGTALSRRIQNPEWQKKAFRYLTVSLDGETGKLIRIHSINGNLDSAGFIPVPRDSAAAQLRRGREYYVAGWPTSPRWV